MKKILLLFVIITSLGVAQAQRVSVNDAKKAANAYLAAAEPSHNVNGMTLYQTFADESGNVVIYLFNIGESGFIAFGADMMYDPLIGYSFYGAYDSTTAAPTLKAWLENYVEDVYTESLSETKSADMERYHNGCQKQWKQLLNGDTQELAAKSAKGVQDLLVTKWDQGGGYNNYCPTYSGGSHGHSYTGCVATAMAQIIRYHRYPRTGFSRYGYTHSYHGYQYAAFDSVTYDYTKMPSSVSTNSLQSVQHHVSQLCYHCGVSVKMNYQNPGHTSGSGAHSEDVPNGFKYFGYENTYYLSKVGNNSVWDSLIRNDLDRQMPIYYSGSNDEGGHAFVLEGYRENGTYQFNFGWSGAGDGFFTISNVGGFSRSQGAVFNIIPSGFGPLNDTIYIASDGEGDGSSWENANPNLHDAIKLANLCNKSTIWVKNGTYEGNTSSAYSFEMESKVKIYGGFNGTESSLEERSGTTQSVMSGGGSRTAFYSPGAISNAAIYDMIFANGKAENGSGAIINPGIRIERCIIQNNTSTNGAALLSNNAIIYNCIINSNIGGGVQLKDGSSIRNSLIAHNSDYGININESSINGCDIVCNGGSGIINDGADQIRNSVIWHNGSQISGDNNSNVRFCAIENWGERDSNSNFGIESENRPSNNKGPMFMNPDLTIGPSETLGDWHISSRSPLVDAGDTNRSGCYVRDLDDGNRFRNGRVDIGCYEWVPGNQVTNVTSSSISIYPNPATASITVEGVDTQADIYDIMGRHLMSVTCHGEATTIDVSTLPHGLYIFRTANKTAKFMVR